MATLHFWYADRRNNWSPVDLGNSTVRLGKWAVTSKAYMGEIGASTIPLDDPTGTLGHNGDQILGLKAFYITETAAPTNNQRLFTGYTRDREYASEESLITGAAVRINTDLADVNDEGHYYLIPGDDAASGKRPAETVDERIAWLLASTYVALHDHGLVASSSVSMPAANYGNQTGADVLDQCALAASFNWGIYLDESSGDASLRFYDPNTSTLETVTLRISNTLSDVDSTVAGGDGATHTWGPSTPVKMKRSPQDTAALYRVPWAHGTESVSRSSTADTYGRIDAVAPDANLTTAAAATARGNLLLWQHRNEEDTFQPITLQLPPAHVNDIREGSRFSARFRNMPGYHDWSWFRVTSRTVGQEDETDAFYTVTLEISPCESGSTAITQTATMNNTLAGPYNVFPAATTVGSLLIHVQTWRSLTSDTLPCDDGETWTRISAPMYFHRTGTPDDVNAVAIYVANCTIAQTSHHCQASTGGGSGGTVVHSVMYEIAGATTADVATPITIAAQVGTVLDIGSLGTVFPQQLAIGVWGNGYDGFGTQVTTHGSWVADWYSSRDLAGVVSSLYGEGFPFSYYAHQIGAGAAIEASTTIDASQKWAGIAVVIG